MVYLTALAVMVMILGTLGVIWTLGNGFDRVETAMQTGFTEETEARLFQLEQLVDALPLKWEEMVKQAKRSEDRARAVVRRAQEELAEAGFEHPGLEAETSEIRRIHGDGGTGEELRALPERMDSVPERPRNPWDEDEEWEAQTLRAKYAPRR